MNTVDAGSPCRNCSQMLAGKYCSECGQEAHAGTATLSHFFHDLTHETLHVDGKIFRSLRALFIEPGRLTAEYWVGRIVSWVRPLRLFLIIAALHLLLVHDSVGPLNFRVAVMRNAAGERHVAFGQNPGSRTKAGFTRLDGKEHAEFLAAFRKAYTSIRYLSVVGFALCSWLLYRKRQRYFVNHLVLSLHYYSFWYALAMVGGLGPVVSLVTTPASLVYMPLMLRRVYGENWGWTVAKAIVLIAVLSLIELMLGMGGVLMVESGWVAGAGH